MLIALQFYASGGLLQVVGEYNTNVIKADLGFTEKNGLLLRSETNRRSADSTTILCECQWLTASGLLQVVGDTTREDKSTVSLAQVQGLD